MAARIEQQPSVREQYAQTLLEEGVVTQEDVDAMADGVDTTLKEAHERLRTTFGQGARGRYGGASRRRPARRSSPPVRPTSACAR